MTHRYADEVEALARGVLPEAVYRYIRQGSRDGVSAGEAVQAWDRFRFRPRVLNDVTRVDLGVSLLGSRVRTPLAVAPTTLQRAAHPDGEVAMARGVVDAGALLVVSSNAGTSFEEIAATGVTWWLQLYVTADRSACLPVLERAVAAGASAVVLTADTPVVGVKYDGGGRTVWDVADPAWLRANFADRGPGAPAHEKATDLGPHDVEWLRRVSGLPVAVKGVVHPADARRCRDAGAAAVWVSNHGGRQLDGVVSTAEALGPVTEALSPVTGALGAGPEVYVDGGLRRGRHVVAAAALGARAAFLGRLPLYALAAGGAAGVARLLEELGEELTETLRLAGHARLGDVHRDLLSGG